METNKKPSNKFSPEVRARAVRMAREQRGDHVLHMGGQQRSRRRQAARAKRRATGFARPMRDAGEGPGATTDERERIKALERENRELRQANEILRKASAYFAQAKIDRRFNP